MTLSVNVEKRESILGLRKKNIFDTHFNYN